jgi:hypothetical protein
LEGAARIIDLGDTLTEYNQSPTGDYADLCALSADWRQIGQDLQEAMLWYSKQLRKDASGVQALTKE